MLHAIDLIVRVSLAVALPFLVMGLVYTILDMYKRDKETE